MEKKTYFLLDCAGYIVGFDDSSAFEYIGKYSGVETYLEFYFEY